MDPIDIQYELRKRGIHQKKIADETKASEMWVSKAIRKKGGKKTDMLDRIMKKVCKYIGKSPSEVFPEYYPNPVKSKAA